MSKIWESIFGPPKPPELEGAFVKESGFVKAQVDVSGAVSPFDVTLAIDTASCWTVLLDKDFINVCKAMGWAQFKNPDILNWIRTQPVSFTDVGPACTVGGKTDSIYLIKGARLCYYLPNGQVLDNKWQYTPPALHGAFSKGYARGSSGSHFSLLGTDHINQLRQLVWSNPKKRIGLTP